MRLFGAINSLKKLSKKFGEPIKYHQYYGKAEPTPYLETASMKYVGADINSKGIIFARDRDGNNHRFSSWDDFVYRGHG